MGVCLATDPDLLADPENETAASNQFATGLESPIEEELSFGRGTRVQAPDWTEQAEIGEPRFTRHFWRLIVAQWPLDLRQQWGDRANELQDSGLDWKIAERTAFEQILEKRKPRPARRTGVGRTSG